MTFVTENSCDSFFFEVLHFLIFIYNILYIN